MTEENSGCLGKMLPHMRHPGGRLTADKGNECEIQFRIKAINTGWVQMGKFWHSAAPWKVKRMLFM